MKKILAAITATMCGICVTSMSNMALASGTETEIRDTVIEQSLILPENIAYIWDTLSQYLWDKETNTRTMDAFIELDKDRKIIIVADNEEILATAKSFVKGKELDESFIDYRIESFEDMIHDGYTVETPVTNDELETLIKTLQTLNSYIYEKGFIDNSAYASLYWDKHAIDCYVQSYAVEYEIKQFIEDNKIDENLITVIVAPEADYRVPEGGQRSYEEVNTIVADEYITLKNYLNDNGILSNVYLTTKGELNYPEVPYSCVEVYVRSQEDVDKLKVYMEENYYWQDVVEITVQSELSTDTDSTIHNKEYICLDGDSNDDGEFGVADVIKLQKYILTGDTLSEREAKSSDLIEDERIDVFDLIISKRMLININKQLHLYVPINGLENSVII